MMLVVHRLEVCILLAALGYSAYRSWEHIAQKDSEHPGPARVGGVDARVEISGCKQCRRQ